MKKVFENYPHSHSICKKGVFKPVKSLEIFQTLGTLHRYLLSENFWQKFQTTFEFMRNHETENAAKKKRFVNCEWMFLKELFSKINSKEQFLMIVWENSRGVVIPNS